MKTKEENRGKEEELSKKKELLSEEELLEVAAGGGRSFLPHNTKKTICSKKCLKEKNYQECLERCVKAD